MRWLYSLFIVLIALLVLGPPFEGSASGYGAEMITAHRGSSHAAPENTLSALKRAIADGAGVAEIDVRMTADGVIVLSHDDSLLRAAGADVRISQSAYEDLKRYDVGGRFGAAYAGERIPTLTEALRLAAGKILLNIDIKTDVPSPGLPAAVAETIVREDAVGRVVVTSFDERAVSDVKRIEPRLLAGVIINMPSQLNDALFNRGDIDILSVRGTLVNRHLVQKAHAHGKKIYAWTINRPADMARMARYGVDSIITDQPDVLYRLLFP
jgi:glycerophosphoryl diester phosphodiesterase